MTFEDIILSCIPIMGGFVIGVFFGMMLYACMDKESEDE